MSRLDHLKQFYASLDKLEARLGGARQLKNCTGHLPWPARGVYFFRETGQERTESGVGPRVVRVGTHALNAGASSKLWQRLRQHRGSAKTKGGNHRGSVFRKIVGAALIVRDGRECPSWEKYGSGKVPIEVRKAEHPLEQVVSTTIGCMPFLWLAVDDEPCPQSERGYIERNAIALLSNRSKQPLDPPSSTWLGQHCSREKVRESGLWNSNHVDDDYEPAFLDMLDAWIERTPSP